VNATHISGKRKSQLATAVLVGEVDEEALFISKELKMGKRSK
jgi:hypothetical protein